MLLNWRLDSGMHEKLIDSGSMDGSAVYLFLLVVPGAENAL